MTDTTKGYTQMNLPEHLAKSRISASSKNHNIKMNDEWGIQGCCPNRIVDGVMNFDGDCINMCAKTLVEVCKKFGSHNFSFGCYRSKLSDEYTGGGDLSQEQLKVMKGKGNMVHFYVINTKLNKIIDRSQGQFQFVDYDFWVYQKSKLYGKDNINMWEIPVSDMVKGGLDITQIRKVRGFVNLMSMCIQYDHGAIKRLVDNFGKCYKNWLTEFRTQLPREYKKFLECCRLDQTDVDKK